MRTPDLRKLAMRQRWMLWIVLAAILLQFSPLFPWGQFGMVFMVLLGLFQVAVTLLMLIGMILMMASQGTHPVIIVILALLMLVPCANLIVVLLVNTSATRTLRKAGLKVGLMGVNPESVERTLNPALCKGCGYDLTGNVSGLCSECGRPTS